MNFDIGAALRRLKPERRTGPLLRRDDRALPFVADASDRTVLLLDTCVYIDVLQDSAPIEVANLLARRPRRHSAVAAAELAHGLGRLDPRDPRSAGTGAQIRGVLADMPPRRLGAPSARAFALAGILAGMVTRLAGTLAGREQALLNDALLHVQALEEGTTLLTRNLRDFDLFDQLLPGRLLFYRSPAG